MTSSIIRDHKAQAGVRARSGRPHARAAPRLRCCEGACDGCRGRLTRIWRGAHRRAREGRRGGGGRGQIAGTFCRVLQATNGGGERGGGKRGMGQAWNKEDININERTRKRRCKDV